MKKLFLVVLLLTLSVTPVLASKPAEKRNQPAVITKQEEAIEVEDEEGIEEEECDVNAVWKNHGQYVSCVARQKPGGEKVSEAARSDVGKPKASPSSTPSATPTPTLTPTPTPSVSPSSTPSASPSATPEATATPEASPTSSPAATLTDIKLEAVNNEIKALIEMLGNVLESLKSLI